MTDPAYRIMQAGLIVARVEGPHALRDIMGHARSHAPQGPLSIQKRDKRHWKAFGVVGHQSNGEGA